MSISNLRASKTYFYQTGFDICFAMFCFVLFACFFPTGFVSSFAVLSTGFALPLALKRWSSTRLLPFEWVGLFLFMWLAISLFWSSGSFTELAGYLLEYRFYFLLPVFASAINGESTLKYAVPACVVGCILALLGSYGLSLGIIDIDDGGVSFGNRIFHGFVMSLLLAAALVGLKFKSSSVRVASIVGSILVVYNVINVETGRTGYLQIFALIIAFIVLNMSFRKAVSCLAISVVVLIAGFYSLETFHGRVVQSAIALSQALSGENLASSIGYRFEFYKAGMQIAEKNLWFGLGVGDVGPTLLNYFEMGLMPVKTDNIHGEFLNMQLAGGIIAAGLFTGFLSCLFIKGIELRDQQKILSSLFIYVGIIFSISALFNSTIKDFGEKHALLAVLSMLAGWTRCLCVKNKSSEDEC